MHVYVKFYLSAPYMYLGQVVLCFFVFLLCCVSLSFCCVVFLCLSVVLCCLAFLSKHLMDD